MKKSVLAVTLALLLMGSNAYALKKVEDITAHDVASVPEFVVRETGNGLVKSSPYIYKSFRFVLKCLAVPFYWLEKVAKHEEV